MKKLTLAEQQKLKDFRVCFEEKGDDDLSICVNTLFDKQMLENYMQNVQIKLVAPNLRVAASLFSKRYAFLMVAAPLYSFSVLNKVLEVSSEKLILKPSTSNEYWLPEIYMKDERVITPSTIQERKKCREELLQSIFGNHLNLLWNLLSSLGKLPKQILWENTSIYIFWLYETLIVETANEEIKERLKDDFHFLLYEAEGSLFGDYTNNPLTKFYHKKSIKDGEALRVRRTCCFAHELDQEGTMCKTCPRKC